MRIFKTADVFPARSAETDYCFILFITLRENLKSPLNILKSDQLLSWQPPVPTSVSVNLGEVQADIVGRSLAPLLLVALVIPGPGRC